MNRLTLTVISLSVWLMASSQIKIEPVSVSASRIEMPAKETGKAVKVLKSEDIARLPVQSFDELLYYVAGVNSNSRFGFGVQSDIGLRGSTFSQVLVLVDEQRINDPLTGHFNSNLPIPLSEIEQIEVIPGPAAVSYGPDAVGGVIHIKTKAYSNIQEGQYLKFSGEAGLGAYGTAYVDAAGQSKLNKTGISFGLRSVEADGEPYVNPNFSFGSGADSLKHTFFDLKTATASITHSGNNWSTYFRGAVEMRSFNAQYFYTASAFDESEEVVSSYWAQSLSELRTENGKWMLNMGLKVNSDSFVFNPAFAANVHTTRRLNSTLSYRSVGDQFTWQAGIQSDLMDIESTDRGNHDRSSFGLFGIGRYQWEKLDVNGGLRVEYSELIGTQVLPQINAVYPIGKGLIRASVGRSIRQADFTEAYVSNNIPQLLPGRNAGNPDLAAETSWSAELGTDINWQHYQSNTKTSYHSFVFRTTFFYRASADLVDFVVTNSNQIDNLDNLAPNSEYLYARNIGETSTVGNESSFEWRWTNLNQLKTGLNLNYTWLLTNAPEETASKYLANHPIHQASAVGFIQLMDWRLTASNYFAIRDRESIDAIQALVPEQVNVTNLKLRWSPLDSPAGVFVSLRNAFDAQYQEILGARMPGRWWMAGIQWNIE